MDPSSQRDPTPAVSAAAVIIGGMPEHRWAPPSHPDPPEDQPLGIDAPPAPERVSGYPAVWVRVEFTRSGLQTCPGFVEQADGDVVYVQLVHMGFVHHVWLPLERIKKPAGAPLMGQRRSGRWVPEEAVSLPADARGGPVGDVVPPTPVHAWVRTYRGVDRRVEAKAIAATSDAVLIEWGVGRPRPRRGCGGLR